MLLGDQALFLSSKAIVRVHSLNKKADVTEYSAVFNHVGLLVNEPSAQANCSSSSHPTTQSHLF
jgi:hypothetical protein